MRYWWVNQNQTYKFEVPGGFLWSPKTRADGGRNYFYECMQEIRPGDVVFSFCDTYIKAIGIAQRSAITSAKPEFRTTGSNWADEGWLVDVEFEEIDNPIRPKDFMPQIIPLLAEKYAPLQKDGNGLQGVYLTEVSSEFGKLLGNLSNADLLVIQKDLTVADDAESDYEINLEIQARKIEGDLEKIDLVKSRRGQGIFKANVRMIEKTCRVTGVSNIKHLRASHIKPWTVSSDKEKIDGYNGLLLSPHVDHLFDRGFISFQDSGNMLISKSLSSSVLDKWSIDIGKNVGKFELGHCSYLEYHRDAVFQ